MTLPIKVKDVEVLEQIMRHPIHPKLFRIVTWWMDRWVTIITCSHREDDSGVHGQTPYRGIDLRSHNYARPESVEKVCNSNWLYDPDRPKLKVCVLHGEGRNRHFHLQVHKNTAYIGDL